MPDDDSQPGYFSRLGEGLDAATLEPYRMVGRGVRNVLTADQPTPDQVRRMRLAERNARRKAAKAGAPSQTQALDPDTADWVQLAATAREVALSDGTAPADSSGDDWTQLGSMMREIQLHTMAQDGDPAARSAAYRELTTLGVQEADAVDRSLAAQAQTATRGADIAERVTQLHAQKHGDLAATSVELAREGWDPAIITPELLAGLEQQKAVAEEAGDAAKVAVLEFTITQLRKEQRPDSLLARAKAGTYRPPAVRPRYYSLVGDEAMQAAVNAARDKAPAPQEQSLLREARNFAVRKAGGIMGIGATALEAASQLASRTFGPNAAAALLHAKAQTYATGEAYTQTPQFEASPSVTDGSIQPDGSLSWKAIAVEGADNAINLGASVAAGIGGTLIGGPAVGLAAGTAVGSALDTGSVVKQTIQDQLAAGANVHDAYTIGMATGAVYAPIAALLEVIPLEEILSKNPAAKMALTEIVQKIVVSGAKEGTTEMAQEAWQDISQWLATNDPKTFDDWQTRYGKAGAWGAVLGAAATAGHSAPEIAELPTRSIDNPLDRATPTPGPGDTTRLTRQARRAASEQARRTALADFAAANGMTADDLDVKMSDDANLTPEQNRIAAIGDRLGIDVIFATPRNGQPLPTAVGAATRRGSVILDGAESGRAAERLLGHEVFHEYVARAGGDAQAAIKALADAAPEEFARIRAGYAAAADKAGIQRSDAVLDEEGGAGLAETIAGRVLFSDDVSADELARAAARNPGAFDKLVSAMQRVGQRLGIVRVPTRAEAIRAIARGSRVAQQFIAIRDSLRETADRLPLDDSIVARAYDPATAARPDIGLADEDALPMPAPEPTRRGIDIGLAPDEPTPTPTVPVEDRGIPLSNTSEVKPPHRPEGIPISGDEPATYPLADDIADRRGLPPRGPIITPYRPEPTLDEQVAKALDSPHLKRKPVTFSEAEMERQLVDRYEALGLERPESYYEQMGSGGDSFTFRGKLPAEVLDIIENYPETKRLFTVAKHGRGADGWASWR